MEILLPKLYGLGIEAVPHRSGSDEEYKRIARPYALYGGWKPPSILNLTNRSIVAPVRQVKMMWWPLGKQLLLFGDAYTPYLLKLLGNEGRILYIGSQDATIGNAYQYRVKDIAAYYIAKIKNIPLAFYEEFEKRDREIEQLGKKLKTE